MRTRIALAAIITVSIISSTVILTVDAVGATRVASHRSDHVLADVVHLSAQVPPAAVFTVARVVDSSPALTAGTFISTLMQRQATPPPPPPPTNSTSTTTPTWECIRYHESTDRYNTATAPDGAYQITESTWEGMGYSGLPYEYSAAAQNAAALELYNARGWEPWTTRYICGL